MDEPLNIPTNLQEIQRMVTRLNTPMRIQSGKMQVTENATNDPGLY
jgi:hypothetical protein